MYGKLPISYRETRNLPVTYPALITLSNSIKNLSFFKYKGTFNFNALSFKLPFTLRLLSLLQLCLYAQLSVTLKLNVTTCRSLKVVLVLGLVDQVRPC